VLGHDKQTPYMFTYQVELKTLVFGHHLSVYKFHLMLLNASQTGFNVMKST